MNENINYELNEVEFNELSSNMLTCKRLFGITEHDEKLLKMLVGRELKETGIEWHPAAIWHMLKECDCNLIHYPNTHFIMFRNVNIVDDEKFQKWRKDADIEEYELEYKLGKYKANWE